MAKGLSEEGKDLSDAVAIDVFQELFHGRVGFGDELLQGKVLPAVRAGHKDGMTGTRNREFVRTVRAGQGRWF